MNDPISAVWNACNPNTIPTPDQYVDCSNARGDVRVADVMEREIRRTDQPLHLLYSGHMGAGKSTELQQLRNNLECDGHCEAGKKPFFCVYIDAEEFIDIFDVDFPEIALGIVAQISTQCRERASIELGSSYLQTRWEEIKKLAGTEVELNGLETSLGQLGKLTGTLKKSPDFRKQVREALRPHESSLLGEVNLIIDKARLQLKQSGKYDDIVIILDSLEKVIERQDQETGRSSHYLLFVAKGGQFNDINSHLVLTVPLPLLRSSDRAQLQTVFGAVVRVLPVIKAMEKDGRDCPTGISALHEVLKKRFEVAGVPLRDVFEEESDCLELCRASGGHIRQLFMLFREACSYVNALPLTSPAIARAIQYSANAFANSVQEKYWDRLRELDHDGQKRLPNDQTSQDILYALCAFEYLNGGEPWYAVNPLVKRLSRFSDK